MIVIFLRATEGKDSLFTFAFSIDLVASLLMYEIEGRELEVEDDFRFILIIEIFTEITSPDGWII